MRLLVLTHMAAMTLNVAHSLALLPEPVVTIQRTTRVVVFSLGLLWEGLGTKAKGTARGVGVATNLHEIGGRVSQAP